MQQQNAYPGNVTLMSLIFLKSNYIKLNNRDVEETCLFFTFESADHNFIIKYIIINYK